MSILKSIRFKIIVKRNMSLLLICFSLAFAPTIFGQNRDLLDDICFKTYEMKRNSNSDPEVWKLLMNDNKTLRFTACTYPGGTTFSTDIDGDGDPDNTFDNYPNYKKQLLNRPFYSFCRDDDCLKVYMEANEIILEWSTHGVVRMRGEYVQTNCN